jgi:MerR family transcriptional regulator, copper efflux regulator
VAFAARLASGEDLRGAVQEWLSAPAQKPEDVSADDWLRFEQDKHERLLATAGRRSNELELMERQ